MALTKISTAMISQSAAAVDLNVDAGTFYVDTTNNRVGVGGKTDPDTPLHVIGTATATTFAGSGASLTDIPNSALTNSSITINSTAVSLGGSLTLTTANIAENTNLYYTNARADARIAAADTDDLSEGSSNLYYTDARVDARVSGGSLGNITTTGYIRGPATFTLDPAAHGDNTGTVVIAGNLQVDGTTTTINSTTLTVDDKNITLASGSVNAAAADGAGFTVDIGTGTNPAITYDGTNDEWDFNKPLNVTGNIVVSGTVDGVDIAARDAVLTSTTTTAGAALPKAGGTLTGALTGTTAAFNSGGANVVASFTSTDTIAAIQLVDANGNVEIGAVGNDFHVMNAGGAAKMIVQGDGNVGIGTDSPSTNYTKQVHIHSTGTGSSLHLTDNVSGVGNGDGFELITHNGSAYVWQRESNNLLFGTGATERMRIDASGSVGIGCTPASTVSLDVQNLSASSNNVFLRIKNATNLEDSGLIIEGQNGGAREYKIGVNSIANTPDLTFSGPAGYRFYTGSAERMRIDSAGNVGIGTTTPAGRITISSDASTANQYLNLNSTESGHVRNWSLGIANGSSGAFRIFDLTAGATRMTIDSSGNVGIGTSSPDALVHAYTASNAILKVEEANGYASLQQSGVNSYLNNIASGGSLVFRNGTGATERMRIDSSGNVGIGISPSNTFSVGASGTVTTRYTSTDTGAFSLLQFENNGSIVFSADHGNAGANSAIIFKRDGAQESMRILADGSVVQGNTVSLVASNFNNQAGAAWHKPDGHFEIATTSNVAPLQIGKNNSVDGSLVVFRKQATTAGSIGGGANWLAIGSGTGNVYFENGIMAPVGSMAGASSTGVVDLGTTARRFKDAHFSGGIQSAGGNTFTSATPMSFNKAGSDTYTKTVLYDSQNDTANNVFSGLTLEMGRLTNSSSATPRTFTISDRGATNRWCFSQYGLSFNPTSGVATAAESLDDYEEGTWSPVIGGDGANSGTQTYTGTYSGKYIKIGRLVTLYFDLQVTALGTTTGTYATIKGFPFNVQQSHMGGGTFNYYSSLTGITEPLNCYVGSNETGYLMRGGASYVPRTALTANTRLMGQVSYYTNE